LPINGQVLLRGPKLTDSCSTEEEEEETGGEN